MIKKYGQVVITEDSVEVIGFHFDGSDGKNPSIEALEWASQKLSALQGNHTNGVACPNCGYQNIGQVCSHCGFVNTPSFIRWADLPNLGDFVCPKCHKEGIPSVYLPMCTSCANTERGRGIKANMTTIKVRSPLGLSLSSDSGKYVFFWRFGMYVLNIPCAMWLAKFILWCDSPFHKAELKGK